MLSGYLTEILRQQEHAQNQRTRWQGKKGTEIGKVKYRTQVLSYNDNVFHTDPTRPRLMRESNTVLDTIRRNYLLLSSRVESSTTK